VSLSTFFGVLPAFLTVAGLGFAGALLRDRGALPVPDVAHG
jgi:hypothetical protein